MHQWQFIVVRTKTLNTNFSFEANQVQNNPCVDVNFVNPKRRMYFIFTLTRYFKSLEYIFRRNSLFKLEMKVLRHTKQSIPENSKFKEWTNYFLWPYQNGFSSFSRLKTRRMCVCPQPLQMFFWHALKFSYKTWHRQLRMCVDTLL